MKRTLLLILFFGLGITLKSQEKAYNTQANIHYYDESVNKGDDYIQERCVLDIYYPKEVQNYATIIWFHGGGLTSGNKFCPNELKNKGICIVSVNYRLYSPSVH